MALSLLKTLFRSTRSVTSPVDARGWNERFVAFLTLVEEPRFLTEDQDFEYDITSMRLRVGLPGRELVKRVNVCLVPVDYVQRDPDLASLGTVVAIVLGKLPVHFFATEHERATALVEWLESAALRHRVVVDYSDYLGAAAAMFGQPVLLEIERRLLASCHATVPTQALRERLMPLARHGVSVIEDPYESAVQRMPRFAPGAVLQLAWFGAFGPAIRDFLEAQLARIARRRMSMPTELAFVSYESQGALIEAMASSLRDINPQFSLRHVPWSLAATADELARADLVIIPQDTESDWGRVKSHNRLIESIRAGRFVVASPIPAYLELAPYAWVGDDLAAGIEWALKHPDQAVERVTRGQAYIEKRFSPPRIAAQWARALKL